MNASHRATLEVLSRLPADASRQTPLLFVHGAFTGAWCWEEHFLPFFADAGYAVPETMEDLLALWPSNSSSQLAKCFFSIVIHASPGARRRMAEGSGTGEPFTSSTEFSRESASMSSVESISIHI